MARPELISFIEQETAQGFGVADIKEQLKSGGWQEADIEEGFAEIVNKGISRKTLVDEAAPVQAEASVATLAGEIFCWSRSIPQMESRTSGSDR